MSAEESKRAFWDNIQKETNKNKNVAEKQQASKELASEKQRAAQTASKEEFWDKITYETNKNRNEREDRKIDERAAKEEFWDKIAYETNKNKNVGELHAMDKRHLVRMAIPDNSSSSTTSSKSRPAPGGGTVLDARAPPWGSKVWSSQKEE